MRATSNSAALGLPSRTNQRLRDTLGAILMISMAGPSFASPTIIDTDMVEAKQSQIEFTVLSRRSTQDTPLSFNNGSTGFDYDDRFTAMTELSYRFGLHRKMNAYLTLPFEYSQRTYIRSALNTVRQDFETQGLGNLQAGAIFRIRNSRGRKWIVKLGGNLLTASGKTGQPTQLTNGISDQEGSVYGPQNLEREYLFASTWSRRNKKSITLINLEGTVYGPFLENGVKVNNGDTIQGNIERYQRFNKKYRGSIMLGYQYRTNGKTDLVSTDPTQTVLAGVKFYKMLSRKMVLQSNVDWQYTMSYRAYEKTTFTERQYLGVNQLSFRMGIRREI